MWDTCSIMATDSETPDYERLFETARELSDAADLIAKQADARRREAIMAAVDAGLSQSEIARRLRITPARVNQIIRNAS